MNGVASTPQPSPHAGPRAERMSRVDTAWLRMDNDVNLMMIVGVWLLTPAITLEALRERIQAKLLQYDRFRQKAVADAMGAQWVDDEAFDITQHVLPMTLEPRPGESERHALQRACGELAATPLDPHRPLWLGRLEGAIQHPGVVRSQQHAGAGDLH